MRILVLFFATIFLLPACLTQQLSSAERLRTSVRDLNDQMRWSRMDLAMQSVRTDYLPSFRERRHDWGRRIKIARSEVTGMTFVDDHTARALATIDWYRMDTMTLHQSVVEQKWVTGGQSYILADESIIEGDPRLFRHSSSSGKNSSR